MADEANDHQDELVEHISAVAAEVRAAMDDDRWVLRADSRSAQAKGHAAAGLMHCAALAEEISAAVIEGREIVGRILTRALFETWAVAYYLHLGGFEALEAVGGDQRFAIERQVAELRRHDSELRERRRRVRRRNAKIEAANRGLTMRLGAGAILHKLECEPPESPVDDADLEAALRGGPHVAPQRLPLAEVIKRLGRLTRERGEEEYYEREYHLTYRSLSVMGAHATLWLFNAYLDDEGGRGLFFRVCPEAEPDSSYATPNLEIALLLTAGLARSTFSERGQDCPAVQAAVAYLGGHMG